MVIARTVALFTLNLFYTDADMKTSGSITQISEFIRNNLVTIVLSVWSISTGRESLSPFFAGNGYVKNCL